MAMESGTQSTRALNEERFMAKGMVKSKVDDAALVARRRSQVLGAAIELFGKRGYHATAVKEIAERAGVSAGLVYQYFGDKEDILFLALQTVLDTYKERIPRATEGIDDPLKRFRAAVHAYCRVIDANIEATVLVYRETKSLSRARRDVIKRKEMETNALIEAQVGNAQAGFSRVTPRAANRGVLRPRAVGSGAYRPRTHANHILTRMLRNCTFDPGWWFCRAMKPFVRRVPFCSSATGMPLRRTEMVLPVALIS